MAGASNQLPSCTCHARSCPHASSFEVYGEVYRIVFVMLYLDHGSHLDVSRVRITAIEGIADL